MKKEENRNSMATATEMSRETYEASVKMRMQGRSGAYTPKGANGIAHEIMATDRANLKNIWTPDTTTKLTKSPTATQVDAVTMKGGKVLERIQYKDTTSSAGMKTTLEQVQSGKYQQAQMRGTKETAKTFNTLAKESGISKRMESTGISSATTKRIGDTFTHQVPKAANIGNAAKASAGMAVGLTAGIEVVKSVANGDSAGECANHVVSKSAESAVTAAASAAAAELTLGATGALLAGSAIPVVGPIVAAAAVGLGTSAVVGGATEGLFDDLGDMAEDVVDTVSDFFSDAADTVSDFFSGIGSLFGW